MHRCLHVLTLIALLSAIAFGLAPAARAADLFGRPELPTAAGVAPPPPAAPAPQLMLPAPLRPILATAVEWQTKMNAAMRRQLLAARAGTSLRPAVVIVLFAFLYGIVHALGPGHGKMVIGSYFLARRGQLAHGVAMSVTAALAQALSAIILVGLLAIVLDIRSAAIMDEASTIQMISYGAIIVIGLWMAYGVITGHAHAHRQGPADDHRHDHHDYGHVLERRVRNTTSRRQLWHLLLTGGAVGLRPCSGAILVLLFSLANGIIAIGIVATFAIAAGVAVTVTTVSLGSLGLRHAAATVGGRTARIAERGYTAVALGGALLIVLFGAAELAGVWTGVLPPMTG